MNESDLHGGWAPGPGEAVDAFAVTSRPPGQPPRMGRGQAVSGSRKEAGLAHAWTLLWLGGMACLTLHAIAGREQDRWHLIRQEVLARQLDATLDEGASRCLSAWRLVQARAAGAALPRDWDGGQAGQPAPAGSVRWQCSWPGVPGEGAMLVRASISADASGWSGENRSRLYWVSPALNPNEERHDEPSPSS